MYPKQSRRQMKPTNKCFQVNRMVICAVGVIFFAINAAGCKPYPEEKSEEQGTIIQICPPFQTALERNLWLSLPSHYVAKKLFRNYMNCQGKEIVLSRQEMVDIRPSTYWDNSPHVEAKLIKFANATKGKTSAVISEKQSFAFLSSAYGGTLGAFTIRFKGHFRSQPILTKSDEQTIELVGEFKFEDFWDFDLKSEGVREKRSGDPTAEKRTRIAAKFMSGRGFKVTSETAQGNMKARIVRMAGKTFVDDNEIYLKLDNFLPKTNEPAFSPLGGKLVEITRESKDKELNFFEIIKILTETCQTTKDLDIKNSCPSNFRQ